MLLPKFPGPVACQRLAGRAFTRGQPTHAQPGRVRAGFTPKPSHSARCFQAQDSSGVEGAARQDPPTAADTDPAPSRGSLRRGGLGGTSACRGEGGRNRAGKGGKGRAGGGKKRNKKKKCKHTIVPEQFRGQGDKKQESKHLPRKDLLPVWGSARRAAAGRAQPVTCPGGGWGQGARQREPRLLSTSVLRAPCGRETS